MQLPTSLIGPVTKFWTKNNRTILTVTNIGSSATAGILIYKNSTRIHCILQNIKTGLMEIPMEDRKTRNEYIADGIKQLVPLVAPILVFYGLSWGSAIASHRSAEKKIAALSASVTLAEGVIKEYNDFRSTAVQEIGAEKVKEIENKSRYDIRDKIEDAYKRNPVDIRPGENLVYDEWSGQVFSASMDKIDIAEKEICNIILKNGEALYDDIFTVFEVSASGMSQSMGWRDKDLVERGYANWKDIGFSFERSSCILSEKYNRMSAIVIKPNVAPRFL